MTTAGNNTILKETNNANLYAAESNAQPKPKEVIILGAGVGGCFSALEMAAEKNPDGTPKYKIKLIDKNPEIAQGSSSITPFRMGLGFHYAHKPTAQMYLKATIAFQKKFANDFRIGANEIDPTIKNNLQHGRYFIMRDSKPSAKEVLSTYQYLQDEYRKLILEDPSNKVFGEPEDFFKILDTSAYEKDVHTENVEVGIETAECLGNWQEFRKFIIEEITKQPNIEVITNAEAKQIAFKEDSLNYAVEVKTPQQETPVVLTADKIVNCTWENVRALNATAGLKNPEIRTNRLKALIVIELPEELKGTHSTFFCMGPYAMFSNLGDGRAAMTFAPETSMFNSTDVEVPEKIKKYLQENIIDLTADESNLSPERKEFLAEIRQKAEEILAGVSKFKKGIDKAKILQIRFGIVQTKGQVDIFDPTSEFSIRDYNGIHEEAINFISNPCMKLGYGPENGEMVKDIMLQHDEELATLKKVHASYDMFEQTEAAADKVNKADIKLLRYALPYLKLRKEIINFKQENLRKESNTAAINQKSVSMMETPKPMTTIDSETIRCNTNTPFSFVIKGKQSVFNNCPNSSKLNLFQKLKEAKQDLYNYATNCCCFFSNRNKQDSTSKTLQEISHSQSITKRFT